MLIEVGAHPEIKLVRLIGLESSVPGVGVEMWDVTVAGGVGMCKHRLAVKKMTLTEEMDVNWTQGQLESLRKASMWCRNVCTFHGVVKMQESLYLLVDRCYGSVQSEMQRNEGRLTLEQILSGITKICGVYIVKETRPTNMVVLPDNLNNLHRVVLEGDCEGVRNILAKAAAGSSESSVRFLLEAQNADGQSALHLACRRGSAELVEAI